MSGLTQGADTGSRLALSVLHRAALLAALSIPIHGCAGGAGVAALDTALTTASVPSDTAVFADDGLAADGQAILAALAAGSQAEDSARLPWENPESGARGLIAAYGEREEEGRDCLAFTTTRENFEGIGLYEGTACEDAAGVLRLRELTSL